MYDDLVAKFIFIYAETLRLLRCFRRPDSVTDVPRIRLVPTDLGVLE